MAVLELHHSHGGAFKGDQREPAIAAFSYLHLQLAELIAPGTREKSAAG